MWWFHISHVSTMGSISYLYTDVYCISMRILRQHVREYLPARNQAKISTVPFPEA